MKSGPLHILIAVFLVLLGILLTSHSLKTRNVEKLLSPLEAKQIHEIRIEHLLDGISLFQENGEWKVKKVISTLKKKLDESEGKVSVEDALSYPVQEDQVTELLYHLNQLSLTEVASIHPDQYTKFQVNEALGIKVELTDSQNTTILIIGKTLPTQQTFVRKTSNDSNPEVYRLKDYFRPLLLYSLEEWKKKDQASIEK